jgi:hypothetical protein
MENNEMIGKRFRFVNGFEEWGFFGGTVVTVTDILTADEFFENSVMFRDTVTNADHLYTMFNFLAMTEPVIEEELISSFW